MIGDEDGFAVLFLCLFVDFPVCSFGSMFYSVYELFVEGGCFLCGCSGWFVVEVDVFVGLFR